MPIVKCAVCGKETKKFPCQLRDKWRLFCSVVCRTQGQKMENHPNWRGGVHIDSQGYRYVRTKDKLRYEHRIIMETALGRVLQRQEHVHHINHDKLDNRLDNLRVLNNSDHQKLHQMCGWAKKYNACVECETTTTRHYSHGLCRNCYMRWYRRNAKTKT